jgi:TolA-binding protein
MRWLVLCFAMIAMPVLAQDKAQTLADIKIELGTLMAEFNSLKAELISSGGAGGLNAGGDALQRLDTIEAALMRLTSQTEAVELKVSRVVSDGTRRIGDMEFRLCEVTEGCDISTLGETSVLGGDTGTVAGTSMMDPAADPNVGDTAGTGGAELAIGEQKDFDRAKEALAAGDFRTAADRFAGFAQSYPGGPLSQEAQYLRGEALSQLGETADAARKARLLRTRC